MIDALSYLVIVGILCTPLIAAYAIVVSVLIRKRKRFAWILALMIAGSSALFISFYATPENEFAGEIAAAITCLSLLIGIPIVIFVALSVGKPPGRTK